MQDVIESVQLRNEENAWSTLTQPDSEGFYASWLHLQCEQIEGVSSGLLLVKDDTSEQFRSAAVWPQPAVDLQALYDIIEQVIAAQTGLIRPLSTKDSQPHHYAVAYPVCHHEQVVAISAIVVAPADKSALQSAMRQLQWGSAWVGHAYASRVNRDLGTRFEGLSGGVDLLATVMSETHYQSAAFRLVAEMNRLMGCELVCLANRTGTTMTISHLSNTVQHGKKMDRIKAVEAAANESADQHKILCWPADKDSNAILRAHQKLADLWTDHHCLTVPLYVEEQCTSAVTFIRHRDMPFSTQERQYCEHLLAFIAISLEEKRLNSRALWKKIGDDVALGLARIVGPKHMAMKIGAAALITTILCVNVLPATYRLSSDAVVATAMQRVVVAPFDGYIDHAEFRAGDRVAEGEVMVQFDDRDLRLEQLRLSSELSQLQGKSQEAVAAYDRSQVTIIDAQIAQTQAKMRLIENKMTRARQLAPFDGVVVSGDLSQKLGAAVAKGDVLFEVAPAGQLRVFLDVKESRIADVSLGQNGYLHLSALPDQVLPIEINKITPVTSVRDGASYFRVEAAIKDNIDGLQPGMEGIGKIEIDQRRLISIWNRSFMEWLRLKLWSFWG